jgi:hypothetical protein
MLTTPPCFDCYKLGLGGIFHIRSLQNLHAYISPYIHFIYILASLAGAPVTLPHGICSHSSNFKRFAEREPYHLAQRPPLVFLFLSCYNLSLTITMSSALGASRGLDCALVLGGS